MAKYFKCNEIIYGGEENKIQFVKVDMNYNKDGGGYCVTASPVSYDGKVYGFVIDGDYFKYNFYRDVLVSCSRRSKKAEDKAREIFNNGAKAIAELYLDRINAKNNRNIKIIEEVA